MGLSYAKWGLIIEVIIGILACSTANVEYFLNWYSITGIGESLHYTNFSNLCTGPSRRIIVGGDQKWTFGFNYTKWVHDNSPFCQNDTLVFNYDPVGSPSAPHGHNVGLFSSRDFWGFMNCSVSRALVVANTSALTFEYKLTVPWSTNFFACTIGDGFHCSTGLMRFFVVPLPRQCSQFG